MTDARGVTVTNHYDSLRRPVDSMSPHGTNRIVYTNLLVAYTVNALNRTNRFGYDPYGRKIWEADPLNRTNWFQYCPCGSLSAVCNPLNQWTHFYYNNAGQLLSTLYPDSYWVSNRYDALGRLACTLDSAGATATNYYNSQGLVYAVSNVLGRVSAAVFDAWDRATSTIDSSGLGTTNQYDLLGRVVMGTAADGSWVGFAYSANTNGPVAATNQLGDVTRFVYDLAGRRIFETNAIGGVVRYSYGVSGELLSLTDANTNTTRWGYDVLGRMLYRTNATSNRVLGLNYDALGRVTNRWTPAKGNIGYTYDPLGNLTNIAYSTQPAVRMQYDPLNRLTNRVDLAGTHQFTYNSAGLLASEDGPWADDTILYTYTNRMPASAGLQGTWAGSWSQAYGYDHGLRLTNMTSAAGPFGYNYQAGKPALLNRLSLPSGPYVDYGFDHMDRLTNQVCRAAGGAVIDAYGRLFNVASQPTRQTRNDGSYVDLAYDKLGQLTNAVGREAGGALRSHEQLSYKYDPAGNLLYRTNSAFVQSFSVNARNELGTVTRSGTFTASGSTPPATTNLTVNSLSGSVYGDASYASAGHTLADGTNVFTAVALGVTLATTNRAETVLPATVSHSYDANGNLTSDGLRGFEYDEDNQLVAITRTNQWRSEFVYDASGRRRIRRELTWVSGTWLLTNEVRYVYSGMLVVQERDVSNNPQVSYTRGIDLSGTQQGAGGIGGLLARTDHTTSTALFQTTFFFGDLSGNVVTLVTTNGQRAAHYLYDPYGNLLAMSGPLGAANLYRSSSKELHAYSGLVYFGKRYYNPGLQRWMNQDPVSESGGINLFQYVGNAPCFRRDPWGQSWLSDIFKKKKDYSTTPSDFVDPRSVYSHPSIMANAPGSVYNAAKNRANLYDLYRISAKPGVSFGDWFDKVNDLAKILSERAKDSNEDGKMDQQEVQREKAYIRDMLWIALNVPEVGNQAGYALMLKWFSPSGTYDFSSVNHPMSSGSIDVGLDHVLSPAEAGNYFAGYAAGYAQFIDGASHQLFGNYFAPALLGVGEIFAAIDAFQHIRADWTADEVKSAWASSIEMQSTGMLHGMKDALQERICGALPWDIAPCK
jgi:RHS repeat-associated protein